MKKLYIVVNVDWFFLSHRKEIAIAAKKDGFNVTVITKDTGKINEIRNLGLNVINLPMSRSGMNIKEELITLKFLHSLYSKEKPDIVHHVGLKVILWGTLAAKIANIKGVVNAVSGLGIFFSEDNKSLLSKLIPRILRFSHRIDNIKVIFQNKEDEGLFIKHKIITHKQAVLIKGSGVDLTKFDYTEEPKKSPIKVVLTARMIEEKGVFILIEAAEKLKAQFHKDVIFLLCGGLDDNPKALKKEDIDSRCDGEYIKWLGYRKDVNQILKDSHIIVLPSYYKEGLPKSLIEGTAIGRPIITTDSIGCRETVVDGFNGYLIPIKNSEILADKLRTLFLDSQLRKQMGVNSRKMAEKYFDLNNVISKHIEIYNSLIQNSKYNQP